MACDFSCTSCTAIPRESHKAGRLRCFGWCYRGCAPGRYCLAPHSTPRYSAFTDREAQQAQQDVMSCVTLACSGHCKEAVRTAGTA